MFLFDKHFTLLLLLCHKIVIKAERWYSAAIIERREALHNFSNPEYGTNYNIQDRFTPLMLIDPKKTDIKRHDFISTSNSFGHGITTDNNVSYSENVIVNYNNTIENTNILKRVRPKRKFVRKKCPAEGTRRSKQLNSKQKSRTRFLEVFQVVEFDHVSCTSSSGLQGTCLPESECTDSGGATMGTCADGYGTCCVTQFGCDDRSAADSGWFTNPDFPSPSTERLSCVFTLDKASEDIRQLRLDFMNFELLPPTDGSCQDDQFIVSGQNVNSLIPILCGINSGQHGREEPGFLPVRCQRANPLLGTWDTKNKIDIETSGTLDRVTWHTFVSRCFISYHHCSVVYIEVGDVNGPIYLTFQTVSSDSRLFSIKITQLTSSDVLAAPTGCVQYFTEPQGYLESFNYRDKSDIIISRTPSYLNNLNYAMCIERKAEICSVTYTNNGNMEIVNYEAYGPPLIPPGQAGVEILNCPNDWLLIAATRLCGERLNDGSVFQDFTVNAPVTDNGAGPIVVWFRSDESYVGDGFKLMYQQNSCTT